MDDIVIRRAHAADAEVIVSLLRELATYEKCLHQFCLTQDHVRHDMMGSACYCDLAFCQDQAAGLACWYWIYKSFGARRGIFVEDLYVRPQARGRGIAKALLSCLARQAESVGGFMEWQVLDWNAPSIAFYERLGASPLTQWRNYRLEGEGLKGLAS